MSRNLIYAIVAVAVLLIGYFMFFAGGAEDVVESAGDAADAVTGAASDAASTAAETASDAVSAASGAAASVTEMLSGAGLGDLSQSLSGLNLEGFDASLLDPANFNLDGLMTALGSAGLSGEAATGLQNVLTQVAVTPDMLAEVLNQIKSALGL
jgi:hypothetical protein